MEHDYPHLLFGKGWGDLPDSAGFLRAFAVTGQVGYEIPTTSFDLVSGNFIPQNLVWGELAAIQHALSEVERDRPRIA